MRPAVTYTPYGTSSKEQTGDIITFTQFEEGNILTKTCNDAEIGDESDDESIMTIDYCDESYHDLISTEMLKDIVTEVRPIQRLTEEKHVIKYVVVLGKCNRNGKEC